MNLNPAALALLTMACSLGAAWVVVLFLEASWKYENWKSYPERKRKLGREPLVKW